MKKVLMLAGAGWLGHKIANKLSANGFDVSVVHLSMEEKFVPQMNCDVKHILGDVCDEAICREAVETVKPDIVIDVHPSPDYVETRYNMLAGRIEHYLVCSSAGVYVPTGKQAADEDAETHAVSEFGAAFIAKRQIDDKVMSLHDDKRFPVTIVRPGIILGEGMVPLELWGLRNPVFFEMVKAGKKVRISNQTDVLMSVVNVEDVAEVFAQAVLNGDKSKGQIFNAVSWMITHREYFDSIAKALNVEPAVEYVSTDEVISDHADDAGFSEPDYRFFMSDLAVNGDKARRILGIENQKSLEDLLTQSLCSVGVL